MQNNFYSFDLRDREEREIEDHCTFRPQIIAESPFISERSLRKYSQQRTRSAPPPPGSLNWKAHKDNDRSFDNSSDALGLDQLQSSPQSHLSSPRRRSGKRSAGVSHMPVVGMFTKKEGFSRTAPPQVGIPIYAFDPFFPPNFAVGKYGKPAITEEVVVEETKPAVVEEKMTPVEPEAKKNKLAPPALPPWLDNPSLKTASGAGEPRKFAIVINKVNRDNNAEEAPTGWQAVLAEMTAKRAQMKNKKPPEKREVEKKPPPKKIESGKRKKPKDFKDIMDELAYKFAVLRGEITEEDDGGEDGTETPSTSDAQGKSGRFSPAAAPTGDKKSGLKADPPRTDSPSVGGGKKLGGKPDLAAMLAKVKSPVTSKAPTPVPPAEVTKETKAPLKLPPPPGVAAAANPPSSAPAVPIGRIAKAKPEQLPGAPPLPAAWPPVPYVAPPDAPKPVSAPPAPVAPATPAVVAPAVTRTTTVRKVVGEQKDLPEGFFIAGTKEDLIEPYEILHKGETTAEFIDKIAELMRRGSELDQGGEGRAPSESSTPSFLQDKATLQATRKLTVSDLPTPASFAAAVNRMKRSNEIRSTALELEKQLEFRNYCPTPPSAKKPPQTPNGSFTPGSSISSHAQVTTPSKVSFYSDKYFETKQLSFRRSVEVSDEDRQPLCVRMEKVKANTTRTPLNAEIGTVYWMQSLRSPPATTPKSKTKEPAESVSTPNVREEYLRQLKSPTVPQSPYLRSHDAVDKRQSVRAERLSAAQQQEKEAQEQEKRRRERLRLKAMETAMATGSYRPRRTNAHQKMIEKYGGKPEIGIDLASVTSSAYQQYASHHLASPAHDDYDHMQNSYQEPHYSQHHGAFSHSSPYYHSQYDVPHLGVDDLLLQQYEN
eukprot:gene29396-35485_t